jgi:hypothetical protein
LTKQQEFWKPKNHIAITWAFFALISTFFFEISSSSNQFKKLKCVLCYPLASIAKCKKTSYHTRQQNKTFALQKHIKGVHRQVWNEWIAQEKDEHEGKKQPKTRGLAPPFQPFLVFFFFFFW